MKRLLILAVLPTVYDLIVQACRLFSSRRLVGPDAADVIAALCHPTEGATP